MGETRTLRTAATEYAWIDLVRSDDPNVVRSREDWDRLITDDGVRNAILPNVDPKIVAEFSKELVFRNGAFAGADFSMLVDILTYRQIYKIWENFGVGERLVSDHEGYACNSPHTCHSSVFTICMSTCFTEEAEVLEI